MTPGSVDDRITAAWRQTAHSVRLEWGAAGARAIAKDANVAVIVDVLSFSTSVSVATDRGAVVIPFGWNGRPEEAERFAVEHDAILATRRAAAPSAGVSLSPASIRSVVRLERLVLPSPNGSTICADLRGEGVVVVAAALRNRQAVATWLTGLRARQGPVSVAIIAAGERWPNGALRPAVEDWWGAGALVSALVERGWLDSSPEALAARASFAAVSTDMQSALRSCASGQELIAAGWAEDVEIAAELDASGSIPVLTEGLFIDVETDGAPDVRNSEIH